MIQYNMKEWKISFFDRSKLILQVSHDVPLNNIQQKLPLNNIQQKPPAAPTAPPPLPTSPPPPGAADYLVTIVTSDRVGAPAQCGVILQLEGRAGTSQTVLPGPCAPVATPVPDRGRILSALPISVPQGDLGALKTLTLSLDTTVWGALQQQDKTCLPNVLSACH